MPAQLLWDCLRYHLGRLPAHEEALLAQRLARRDWDREAALHGLGGLMEAAAQQLEVPIRPHVLRSQARVNAAYEMECLLLSEKFGQRGLPVMVLKGGALLLSVYAGRSGWRCLRDLDLMVESQRREEAVGLLLELGYRPSPGGFARAGLELDLHCDLWGSERIPQRGRVWGLPPQEAWGCSQALCEGSWMRRLGTHHQIQHVVVHALKHSYQRLIWLADVGFLTQLQGAPVATSAAMEVAQGVAERLLWRPLGGPPPQGAIPWLAERLVDSIRGGRAPEWAGEVVVALLQPSWGQRARYLGELLVPPEAELRRMYPTTPRPLLLWRRLFELLKPSSR